MTRDSVSKLKLGEESVYIRRQPSVCLCVCVCVCVRARVGRGAQSLCRWVRHPWGPSQETGLESKMGQEVMFMREGQQQ